MTSGEPLNPEGVGRLEIRPAIEQVLSKVRGRMSCDKIIRQVQDLCGSVGSQSVGRELSVRIKSDPNCPWRRVKRGVYEWKDKTQVVGSPGGQSAEIRSRNRPSTSSRERKRTKRKMERAGQDQWTLPPEAADEEPFDPDNEKDARERTERTIIKRRGQKDFRDSLISAYGGKCAITACSTLDVLEAAHIVPYRGAQTNKISNGLLLRADLHTLFDCKLLAIDPDTKEILLAPRIGDSEYKKWRRRHIRPPQTPQDQPNKNALRTHLEACRNAWQS